MSPERRERIEHRLFRLALQPTERRLERIGDAYGAWSIPRGVDASWRCLTAGIGEEAVFDVALAERGCRVVAVDPTPRALTYIEPIAGRYPTMSVEPYAVWTDDAELTFYAPQDPAHVSFSATNRQATTEDAAITVPARRLETIAADAGLDRVDLLKLDIEGAEYAVLPEVDLRAMGVRVLCVEFHNDHGLLRMIRAVLDVVRRGYRVAHVHRTDVTLVTTAGGLASA